MCAGEQTAHFLSPGVRLTLKMGAVLTLLVWASLIALTVLLVILGLSNERGPVLVRGALAAGTAFLATSLTLIVCVILSRCPRCSEPLLVNSWTKPHPSARRAALLGYKSVVLDVLYGRTFNCYHCGGSVDPRARSAR